MRSSSLLLALVSLSLPAQAEPIKLRVASLAPEGSGWAREMHGFSRDVEAATGGHVQIKWYLGGVAGDEATALDRVKRGQLDGAGLTLGCERLAPSLHVTRLAGLIRSNAEARYVYARLHPRVATELARAGYFDFGIGPFGTIMIFSRQPIRSFAEMTRTRFWVWDADPIWGDMMRRVGLNVVPTPIADAARAYEEQRIDGFLAPPGPALVYQWSTLARYYTELPIGVLPVCFVMAQRAIDAIPLQERAAFTTAAAKFSDRFQDITRDFDAALVNGLLQKQGLVRVPPTEALSSEFFEATRRVRDTIDQRLVPAELRNEVLGWLADYRAEHQQLP